MRSTCGKAVLGVGTIAIAVAISGLGCTARSADDVEPSLTDVSDELVLEAKPAPSGGSGSTTSVVTMTCTQASGGCVPSGYRGADCALSNLKPNSYVTVCVKAVCPSVYGFSNGNGETCFTMQRAAADGSAFAFFALAPDATYSFMAYSGAKRSLVATATSTLLSSIGDTTQCGGTPSSSCF